MQLLSGHVRPFELMVEEYVDAPLWHVDGLMADGAVLAAVACEYTDVEGQAAGSAVLDEDDPRARRAHRGRGESRCRPWLPAARTGLPRLVLPRSTGEPPCCARSPAGSAGWAYRRWSRPPAASTCAARRSSASSACPVRRRRSARLSGSGYVAMPARAGKLVAAPDSIPFDWVVSSQVRGRAGAVYSRGSSRERHRHAGHRRRLVAA